MATFMHVLTSLSKEELCNLSNEDLCKRMDAVLYNILCESYTDPQAIEVFPRQSIQDFYNTKKIKSLSQKHQRDALRKCFEYLVQHEYLSRISGWINDVIYGANYNEDHFWLSSRVQSINCTARQLDIVGSGIACDRMMDLLHIIDTGIPLNGKKSKFKPFKKWLLNPKNRFVFFAPNLINIHKFRSQIRTAEVHEWSKLPNNLLLLQQPSFEESNEPLKLINILLSMWNPLLDLLNEKNPVTTQGSGAGLDWLKAINDNNVAVIQVELDKLNIELSKV